MKLLGWRKPKINGQIGYFGLADWWLSEFNEGEREYIEKTYKPLNAGSVNRINRRPLTQGEILSTTQTVGMFLSGLSSWFSRSREDRDIARRILTKAIQLIDSRKDILGLHFTYQALIEVWYRDRDTVPNALYEATKACEGQISIAIQAAKVFKKQYPKSPLPAHVGFEQLTIIRDKQGEFADGIRLAKEAKRQGWAGDWDKRIERYQKKLAKQKI